MSIRVVNLTKVYGAQKAVNNISFTINEGEIVGFLGPNGAGKSTTMKIIAGYLPATEGTVTVAGKDVVEDPMYIKRITGYLPEHNPLYTDMYVHEYLEFVAGIYGMSSSSAKSRKAEVIQQCGLTAEQNKRIGMLSKGYRQRVGLAQALIHQPKVLVLDEPTSGLDPNQLIEIRRLIKEMSRDRTVLFSSHVLQEVEALCDRVVVIHRGEIVADDSVANLTRAGTNEVMVEFDRAADEESLLGLDGVVKITSAGKFRYRVSAKPGSDIRSSLARYASEHKIGLVELKLEQGSLENVFGQLTGATEKVN